MTAREYYYGTSTASVRTSFTDSMSWKQQSSSPVTSVSQSFWLYQNLPSAALSYIPDRLYLAAYISPPTHETHFPYPDAPVTTKRRGHQQSAAKDPNRSPPCYFTVDDTLLYNAFHHDFGPLHIGHLYRFAIQFHEILGAKENRDRPIVFWSAADPRSKYRKYKQRGF